MYKAYKFILYPDSNQRIIINKMLGCSRYIYNHCLSKMKDFEYVSSYTNIIDYTSNLKYKDISFNEILRQLLYKSHYKGKYFY